MAGLSITLGGDRLLQLDDNNQLYAVKEFRGEVDVKVLLCNGTKKDISALQDYLEKLKIFVPE